MRKKMENGEARKERERDEEREREREQDKMDKELNSERGRRW